MARRTRGPRSHVKHAVQLRSVGLFAMCTRLVLLAYIHACMQVCVHVLILKHETDLHGLGFLARLGGSSGHAKTRSSRHCMSR